MTDFLESFFLEDPRKLDDPFADLAWLREHHPIYHREALGQWFVFRYDDVRALFADRRLSADRVQGLVQAVPAAVRADVEQLVPWFGSWLMMNDGAEHSRLRRQLHTGFNASVIESLKGPIERAASELLERRLGQGSLDISSDFALLLPAYVLADFVGAAPEDRDRFVGWSLDFVEFFNVIPISEQATKRMMRTVAEMSEYFRALLAESRREAREDFLGAMIAAGGSSQGMTDEEIVANTIMLLLAGHLPVRNVIGNAVWLLLSRPEQMAAVRSDLSLLAPALEETLRYEPPVTLIPRIALEDLEVAGVTIPAGAIIQLSIAAANRDPGRFPDPDVFDVNRDPHGVLSFGHGPHGCLGARLAREQSLIALRVLFERLDGMRVNPDAETRWYRNAANRGPDELRVTFAPIA